MKGKIGLFWIIRNSVLAFSEPIEDGDEVYGGNINPSKDHWELWEDENLDKRYGFDYAAYKRGRVIYNKETNHFKIYTGTWITQSQIRDVCYKFDLDEKTTELVMDEHYELDDAGSMLLASEKIKKTRKNFVRKEKEIFTEMATITCDNSNDNYFYKVAVYGESKYKIPHLHFYRTKEDLDKKLGGCICLEEAKYFKHDKHVETLNSKDLKYLINWFKKPNKDIPEINNYKACRIFWNVENPDENLRIDPNKIIDYSKLNMKKD